MNQDKETGISIMKINENNEKTINNTKQRNTTHIQCK